MARRAWTRALSRTCRRWKSSAASAACNCRASRSKVTQLSRPAQRGHALGDPAQRSVAGRTGHVASRARRGHGRRARRSHSGARIVPLRDAAVAIAGDDKTVSEYAKRVHGGSVSDLHLGTKAKTLGELFALPNLTAAVTLADGAFVVPELEREATNLAGHVELRDSKLVASGVSGRLDESRVADANGEYDLASGDASVSTGSTWRSHRRSRLCAACCRRTIARRSRRFARSRVARKGAEVYVARRSLGSHDFGRSIRL